MTTEIVISKQRLLLLDCFSPDYYVLRLRPEVRLPATVQVTTDSQEITVSPEIVQFRTVDQRVELVVAAVTEPKKATFVLSHRLKEGLGSVAVLEGYYLTKGAMKIYSCGWDNHYQLAASSSLRDFVTEFHVNSREEPCRPVPQVVARNDSARQEDLWVGLAAGDAHVLACTTQGKVVAWGFAQSGQLGISQDVLSTIADKLTTELDIKVRTVTNKEEASERMGYSVPIPTEIPGLRRVVQVACGARHSLVLTQDYTVCSFGEGSAGQLGLGSTALYDQFTPQLVEGLSQLNIVRVLSR